MPRKQTSNVDVWPERETPRVRRALESASRHFDADDDLTVNTLEAVYGQESSFGSPSQLGERASSAAARYLKDLHNMFGQKTGLPGGRVTTAVKSVSERKRFAVGAFNAGEGRVAGAQRLAEQAGKNPRLWNDVQQFIAEAGGGESKEKEVMEYVEKVLRYEAEFAIKSPADKSKKQKKPREKQAWCTEGHWRTIDDRPVFICA